MNNKFETIKLENYIISKSGNLISSIDTGNGLSSKEKYDPFAERKVKNPTTNVDTLVHLLKATIGTGILSMPCAFRNCGIGIGIISTIIIAIISTHCSHLLVKCAHVLYYKTKRCQMSYADVAETALSVGPTSCKKFGKTARYVVDVSMFLGQFCTGIAYVVIVAKNIKDILDYHQGGDYTDIRLIIAALLLPLILLTWIPDLKYLVPVSLIANLFMLTSLLTIFYWLTKDLITSQTIIRPGFNWFGIDKNETVDITWYSKYPQTFSITVFALGAIGVIMPLENKMKTPEKFIGPFGVLSQGMILVTFIYTILGILGYLYNPIATEDIITLEMPIVADYWNSIIAQAVRLLVALSIFCSFCLQFFVSIEISWRWIEKYFTKNKILANYSLRTILVILIVILAIVFPDVLILLGLVGGFGGSILSLLVPVVIETTTYWDDNTSSRIFRNTKNIIISIVAIFALYFSTADSLRDIKKKFIDN